MQPRSSLPARLHVRLAVPALALGALLLAACTDEAREVIAPTNAPPAAPVAALAVLTCTGSASAITCEPAASSERTHAVASLSQPSFDRVLGGQNTYVRLTATSNSFDSPTNRLSSVVSVQNLTTQPLGTTNGSTLDPDAVRVFFHTPPTNGVTLVNPDGSGTFTASNQAFYKYNEIIPANASNVTAKTWVFQLPDASTTFTFQVYVTGNQPNESGPVVIPPHTFTALASGNSGYFGCAIRSGGVSYCWGYGFYGQLGNGSTLSRSVPTGVVDSMHFTALARGHSFACGLTSAGSAYCWGYNVNGQLGDSTLTQRTVPVRVRNPAGVTFTSLAAGDLHACGVTSAGVAYCWGSNAFGQLGDSSVTQRVVPTRVHSPAGVSFTSITAGVYHSCGMTGAGTGYCWGLNSEGQLGDSTTTQRVVPKAVQMPVGVSFAAVSAGAYRTCGLTSAGSAYCWGYNGNGQLGDGTTTQRNAPTLVQGPVTFSALRPGFYHTCGVASDGSGYCWGYNGYGQLGDGTLTQRLVPTAVQMPAGTSFNALGAGVYYTCGLATTGAAYCWGNNVDGQVGDGTNTNRSVPTAVQMP